MERFRYFQFLTGNGMEPNLASAVVLSNDYRPAGGGWLRDKGYDESASRQMSQLRRMVDEGTFWSEKSSYFDMALGKVKTFI